MKKESLATKRAKARNYDQGSDWYCSFKYQDVNGIGYEEGVCRRDPSAVLLIGDTYYTWYTKSIGESAGFGNGDETKKVFPWDLSEIWYATSKDCINWEEKGLAVGLGEKGAYDDRSVFTPEVLSYEGRYYLVYQCVKAPYVRRVKNTIGMAYSDSPDGPFIKLDEPILYASDTGVWYGEDDNRFLVKVKGDFDSHKVHDPCLMVFKDKFYLYYKGERMGEEVFMGGRETKWGVAIADNIFGPYIKSEYNPVTNSGHETCLWHFDGGLGALLTSDGMERNTVQYTKDGVNFEIMGSVKGVVPHAAGPFRGDSSNQYPLEGLSWGLCFDRKGEWDYIRKYEIDEKLKFDIRNKITYE